MNTDFVTSAENFPSFTATQVIVLTASFSKALAHLDQMISLWT